MVYYSHSQVKMPEVGSSFHFKIKDYLYYYAEFLDQGGMDTYMLLLFLMKMKQLKQPNICFFIKIILKIIEEPTKTCHEIRTASVSTF